MAGENIRTTVQQGETLSLYANMYNVKIADIKAANGMKGNTLKEGAKIEIPIGKKQETEEPIKKDNYFDRKVNYWQNELEEKRLALYDPDLTPEERETLEAEFIKLQNAQRKRKEVADVTFSEDQKSFTMTLKQGINAGDLRDLYNLQPGALKAVLDFSGPYIAGEGFVPDLEYLEAGRTFTMDIECYNNQNNFKDIINRFDLKYIF